MLWQKGLLVKKLSTQIYQSEGKYVAYPLVVSGADTSQLNLWNSIILEDINKIIGIYSLNSYPRSIEGPDVFLKDTLHINYYVKRNDDKYLSILYTADYYNPYSPYPTQSVYTSNIDLQKDRRMYLHDLIGMDTNLSTDLTSWELITKDMGGEEYRKALIDYILGLGNEILRKGLLTADIIGHENFLGIFSYITPTRKGLSISVPHYLGDHAEFERDIE